MAGSIPRPARRARSRRPHYDQTGAFRRGLGRAVGAAEPTRTPRPGSAVVAVELPIRDCSWRRVPVRRRTGRTPVGRAFQTLLATIHRARPGDLPAAGAL